MPPTPVVLAGTCSNPRVHNPASSGALTLDLVPNLAERRLDDGRLDNGGGGRDRHVCFVGWFRWAGWLIFLLSFSDIP